MLKLRKYQDRIAKDAAEILQRKKIVCIFMEVRTGKTITSLETCKLYDAKKVLFITKIKAFSSIKDDYTNFGYTFDLTIINRESLHKVETNDFDVVIIDEVHGYSSYPKPSKYHKDVKSRFGNIPMIMLSGTPSPESFSQFYHLFTLSNHNPFKDYKNFYKWAEKYVNVKQRNLGYATVNDYSDARKIDFWHLIRYYILTFTQQEAGFSTTITENVLEVEMKPITYQLIKKLNKDLVLKSSDDKIILADTAVKLQQKIHQLSSGTIKFEDGSRRVIDNTKACFIQDKFKDKKIAIFYKFIAELEMLKDVFKDTITTDLDEFNATDKNIACQFVSSREGISLKQADYIVALNIDFSAVTYFQFKDRMTTIDRIENTIYFVFTKNGIENKIYKAVQNKKSYTNDLFKKDYAREQNTKQDNQTIRSRRLVCN